MFKLFAITSILCISLTANTQANDKMKLLDRLDLNREGLEQVKSFYLAGDSNKAVSTLLIYYKNRTNIVHPDVKVNVAGKPITGSLSIADKQKADDALSHKFFVMKGYSAFDYGKDINWQLWPIKDNEVKWQLHRMAWWESMALAYVNTNDEKYSREWVAQYLDWIKKNPLGLSKENDRFAWRPLEVSERLELQSRLFLYFVKSPAFDEDFLVKFLLNYSSHADFLLENYTEKGNHLLFQAQRMIYAGTFFPELKRAFAWQESGIGKLNEQIGIQVLDDGVQDELAFHYHVACVNIFYKALQMLSLNGISGKFPQFYIDRLEKMMMAVVNFSFPDYSYPMFSDSWLTSKSVMLKNFRNWSSVYPNNQVLKYFGSDGQEGKLPDYTSGRLPNAGIYAFRSDWSANATALILKASPPAEWHSQPDNGTFELWVKGRNFMPDPGVFLYAGSAAINAQRAYFRQTRLHNTLTLNNQNLNVDAHELQWSTSEKLDYLVYENPSYTNLKHRRAVFFIDKKYFVIVDEAIGEATGDVAIHFGLKEGEVNANPKTQTINTQFKDNNNVVIKAMSQQKSAMEAEESFVSYAYNQKIERPAYAVKVNKPNGNTARFITVIVPYNGITNYPEIKAKFVKATSSQVKVKVSIDGVSRQLGYDIP
ncbi:heparin-sulfate lyase HepC [Pseudopedobacter beijingensis]|uniref:Heparin-sulfate lyase HepC n=1 Tax=Pseudopedobacter beijingensis TaxID=1207056 RepID=A0ABW4IEW2_9SPHI